MPRKHTWFCTDAPAKLNPFLEIIERRDDGYHDLETVMMGINLCDDLRLRTTDAPGIDLRCQWDDGFDDGVLNASSGSPIDRPELPSMTSNLIYRALLRFTAEFGYGGGFECVVSKRIPTGAGLGGASSDAAAALRLAAVATGFIRANVKRAARSKPSTATPSDPETIEANKRLHRIAAGLGSDLNFFLPGWVTDTADDETPMITIASDPHLAALATSRGECVRPLMDVPANWSDKMLVLVHPGVALSTASVFARATVPVAEHRLDSRRVCDALLDGDAESLATASHNRLFKPAVAIQPQIDCLFSLLADAPAVIGSPSLTGSGSVVYAWVDPGDAADVTVARLRDHLVAGVAAMRRDDVIDESSRGPKPSPWRMFVASPICVPRPVTMC